ncbi:MAG: hypothetical protein WCO28_12655 [Bacteroidota bacterium]
MTIQKWVGIVKTSLPEKLKPKTEDVIFIDVSKSKYLVPLNSDSTENDVVTNRKYLAQLFNQISANKNLVKYIFCDVKFDVATIDDSLLIASTKLLDYKFLCINNYAGDSVQENLLKLRSATATIDLQSGSVYKIPFFGKYHDTLVPYKIYYDLHQNKVTSNVLVTWFKNKGLSFNTQISDYPLRNKDFEESGGYIKIGLGELVSLVNINPNLFKDYLQNRFILIGDFENDVHSTYLNNQAGTLILFNAYWHLKKNKEILSFWYLLLLYVFLYIIAWLQVNKKSFSYIFNLKVKYFHKFQIPINILSISILLIVFTCISSLVFEINISIFHLILIFSFIDIVKYFIDKFENKK